MSIPAPGLMWSVLMVRVHPVLVLARREPLNALVQVVERHGEVMWVPARRLESEARSSKHTDLYEGEHLEADERRLLGELVDRDAPGSEHGDPELGVDRVVALRVVTKDGGVE